MTTHVLAYIKRHVATRAAASKAAASSEKDSAVIEALTAPAGHGFGQDWLWGRHRRGERIVIWLVSVLRFGRRYMPPSLDARIEVGEAFDGRSHAPPYVRRLLDTYRYAFTAELRATIPSEGIRRAVEAGCGFCRYGIAIRSKSYASEKSPWTRAEYEVLRRKAQEGKLKLIEINLDGDGPIDNLKDKLEGLS